MKPRRVAIGVGAATCTAAAATVWLVRRPRRADDDLYADDDFSELEDVQHRNVATSDGGTIHVVERGQGRPFVLLPGVTLTTSSWGYQLTDLVAAGYRAVALDIRGHGRSVAGDGGFGLARLAEDVRQVMEALRLRDAIVVGHSLGGMTALQLLLDSPDLALDGTVAALVLVSTSASMVIGNGIPQSLVRAACPISPAAGRAHVRVSTSSAESRLARAALARLYCRIAFGATPSPTHLEQVRAMTSAVAPEVLSPLIVTLMNMDLRKLVAGIAVPTLVVVGQRDVITPSRHSRLLHTRIPDAELVVLQGCGHLVLYERRAELARLLVDWAERCPGQTAGTTAHQPAPA